jgi:hypothetical protein
MSAGVNRMHTTILPAMSRLLRLTFLISFCLLGHSGFAEMMEIDDENGRFMTFSAIGPIGIGDQIELLDGAAQPRRKAVSCVYLGDAIQPFHLRGKASLWLWAGPLALMAPLIILPCLMRFWKRNRGLMKMLLFGVCGWYYGMALIVFSGVYGGNFVYRARLMTSPFGFATSYRYTWLGSFFWLGIGVLLASQSCGWAKWGLPSFVIVHYLTAMAAVFLAGITGGAAFQGTRFLITACPGWIISWILLYLTGQIVLWKMFVKGQFQMQQNITLESQ